MEFLFVGDAKMLKKQKQKDIVRRNTVDVDLLNVSLSATRWIRAHSHSA